MSGQKTQITQAAGSCAVTVSPSSVSFPAAGGDSPVSISTQDFCPWNVDSTPDWITVASRSGTGSTDLTLHAASTQSGDRSGAVVISGQNVSVAQTGPSSPLPANCSYTVAPASFTGVAASPSTVDVTITTQSGCPWSGSSGSSWISLGSASGAGNATVHLNVAQNTGATRAGTVTIAGRTVTINQLAGGSSCTYSIAPSSYNPSASGGSQQVTVSAGSGCDWTASENASWLSLNRTSGTGNGTVTVTAQANTGGSRTATVTIAGQTFTVNQAAACSYTLNPTSLSNVSASGSTSSVAITTTSGCAWTVTANPSWVGVNPSSGTGSGSVSLTIQSNSGASRSATLQIAGQNFTVSQAAAPCTYSLNPTSISVNSTHQTKHITVTTQSFCPVSASSNQSWVDITSAPTTGSGDVNLDIARNTGSARTAVVNVTGQGFNQNVSVAQDAP